MPIEQGNYLLHYEDSYNPRYEQGWALCDSKFRKHYKTESSRKGRTLIQCLEDAKKNGHRLYLCKDYPDNIKDIDYQNKRRGREYVKSNAAFKEMFSSALLLLSQVDFTRDMLAKMIEKKGAFIFDTKMDKDKLAYVENDDGKDFKFCFGPDFKSCLELAKVVVHELHHTEQTFRPYVEPETNRTEVWDLQSSIFKDRVLEADALVAETYFLHLLLKADDKDLVKPLKRREKSDKHVRLVFEHANEKSLAKLFAIAYVAAYGCVCKSYDKGIVQDTRDYIYASISRVKEKGGKIKVFSIHQGNINREIYSKLSAAGIPFGKELKALGIDLLHPRFFGIDRDVDLLQRFRRRATKLSSDFNSKSFTAVVRNGNGFKRYISQFVRRYDPEVAKRKKVIESIPRRPRKLKP